MAGISLGFCDRGPPLDCAVPLAACAEGTIGDCSEDIADDAVGPEFVEFIA